MDRRQLEDHGHVARGALALCVVFVIGVGWGREAKRFVFWGGVRRRPAGTDSPLLKSGARAFPASSAREKRQSAHLEHEHAGRLAAAEPLGQGLAERRGARLDVAQVGGHLCRSVGERV